MSLLLAFAVAATDDSETRVSLPEDWQSLDEIEVIPWQLHEDSVEHTFIVFEQIEASLDQADEFIAQLVEDSLEGILFLAHEEAQAEAQDEVLIVNFLDVEVDDSETRSFVDGIEWLEEALEQALVFNFDEVPDDPETRLMWDESDRYGELIEQHDELELGDGFIQQIELSEWIVKARRRGRK